MKKIWGNQKANIIGILFLGVLAFSSGYFKNDMVFYFNICLLVLYLVFTILQFMRSENKIRRVVKRISQDLSSGESNLLNDLKLPMVISLKGEIVWYNNAFEKVNKNAAAVIGKTNGELFGVEQIEKLRLSGSSELRIENKIFKLYSSKLNRRGDDLEVFYLFDRTKLHKINNNILSPC